MAMGVVSDKDFNNEKEKIVPSSVIPQTPSPSPSAIVVDNPTKGRGIGSVEVPDSLRNVIGQTAIDYGRRESLQLGESFGISPSSVSAYAAGANSTATYDERPNAGIINRSKDRIAKRARGKLLLALNKLTDEKMNEVKARDLAGIAKDMSVIMKSMEPDGPVGPRGNNSPTFVFYSPHFKQEETFDVVQAKE